MTGQLDGRFHQSLVSALYAEALLLADEARAWFELARNESASEEGLMNWDGRFDPALRILLSCESLRLTTRVMHVIAWLLLQRAIDAGEVPASAAYLPTNRLGSNPGDAMPDRHRLPEDAQRLIVASERLYERVARMDATFDADAENSAPQVRLLLGRLSDAF